MGKYTPLYDYLMRLDPQAVDCTLTFQQIETIIGAKLPPSAWKYQAWWANPTKPSQHPYAQAWLGAGWKVDGIDQQRGWVHFRRLQRLDAVRRRLRRSS